MKLHSLFLVALLAIAPLCARAQLAYVNSADLGNNGGATNSLTTAYTVTLGSSVIYIVILGTLVDQADDITSVTYGGVSATLQLSDNAGSVVGNENRWKYIYAVFSPLSGSNNVVITAGNIHYLLAGVAEYSGTIRNGPPDSTDKADGGNAVTSVTATTTTVASNVWIFGLAEQEGNSGSWIGGGAGSFLRVQEGAFRTWAIYDSNGTVNPPGSHSMTTLVMSAPSSDLILDILSFAPLPGYLMLMGCCN